MDAAPQRSSIAAAKAQMGRSRPCLMTALLLSALIMAMIGMGTKSWHIANISSVNSTLLYETFGRDVVQDIPVVATSTGSMQSNSSSVNPTSLHFDVQSQPQRHTDGDVITKNNNNAIIDGGNRIHNYENNNDTPGKGASNSYRTSDSGPIVSDDNAHNNNNDNNDIEVVNAVRDAGFLTQSRLIALELAVDRRLRQISVAATALPTQDRVAGASQARTYDPTIPIASSSPLLVRDDGILLTPTFMKMRRQHQQQQQQQMKQWNGNRAHDHDITIQEDYCDGDGCPVASTGGGTTPVASSTGTHKSSTGGTPSTGTSNTGTTNTGTNGGGDGGDDGSDNADTSEYPAVALYFGIGRVSLIAFDNTSFLLRSFGMHVVGVVTGGFMATR
jgi:hypothetical protein